MEWEKPRIAVIDMNAEIGSYQPDFEDEPIRGVGPAHQGSKSEPAPGSPTQPAGA